MKKIKKFLILSITISLLSISTQSNASKYYSKQENVKDEITAKSYSSGNSSLGGATGGSLFRHYFHDVSWIKRDGKWSLSINPTDNLRNSSPKSLNEAWDRLKAAYSSDSRWQYNGSLYWQFVCHRYAAKNKSRWNIEPWRKNIGATCNGFPF